ncbi:hypothetical protein HY251_02005, partial [bacterium]|nr:hypothetical protein [bacterium]
MVVLGVALSLRLTTRDIPHLGSDEPWNEGLAASLLEDAGYTLRRVDIALVESGRALALVSIGRGAREGVLRFYGDQRAVV